MSSAQIMIAVVTGSGLAAAASAHCALMCGPLALATRVRQGTAASMTYFAGRAVGYAVLGALAGSAGKVMLMSAWARWVELGLSWLLALVLGITAIRMLRGASGSRPLSLGRRPRVSLAGRMLVRVADDPLLLGAATALLPCGALFSGLLAAAHLGNAAAGALAMLAFAAISSLALLAVGALGRLDLRDRRIRRAVASALLLGAALMVYRPLPMLRAESEAPACHVSTSLGGATVRGRRGDAADGAWSIVHPD